METSLRYSGDSGDLKFRPKQKQLVGDFSALRIHAKQKLRIGPDTHLQVHGELNTRIGAPSFLSAVFRHFFPDLSASIGAGLLYDRQDKLRYTVRGKKSFPVRENGLVNFNFNLKGRCDFEKEFKERIPRGAAELSWSILNFQNDQDIRLKVGYEIFDKIPYFQFSENNWTINADINGKWNVRYDL